LGGAVAIWPAIVAERVDFDRWLPELSFLFAASTAAATVIVVAAAVIFRGADLQLFSSLLEGGSLGGGAGVDDDQPTASAVGLSTAEIQALLIVAVLAVAASVAVAATIAAAAVAEALAEEEEEEEEDGETEEGANSGYGPLSASPEGPLTAPQRSATSSSPGGIPTFDVRRRPVASAALDRGH
jgi:ribosomal protein L12E/L44/L45/RPP1/RPP2